MQNEGDECLLLLRIAWCGAWTCVGLKLSINSLIWNGGEKNASDRDNKSTTGFITSLSNNTNVLP